MKKPHFLNLLLFKNIEIIVVKDSNYLSSIEFKTILRKDKLFTKKKSNNSLKLEYNHEWNTMKELLPTYIVNCNYISSNKIEIIISYPLVTKIIYLAFPFVGIPFMYFIESISANRIMGEMFDTPFPLFYLPFAYTILLINFVFNIDTCKIRLDLLRNKHHEVEKE